MTATAAIAALAGAPAEPVAAAATAGAASAASAADGSAAAAGGWALEPFGLPDWPRARQLLLRCYPCTPAALWDSGIDRLRRVPSSRHGDPIGMLLCGAQGPQGLALLLASRRPAAEGREQRRVNGSSWAILPAARDRALWMARRGLAEPDTVYTALTPIPSALLLLQRIGFQAVTHQCVLASLPRLAWQAARGDPGPAVLAGAAALHALRDDPLAPALHDHAQLGCEVLALQSPSGVQGWVPLVFRPQRRLGWLRTAELVYTPSQALLALHAHALAAPLLRRGYALLAFDAHQDLVPGFPCTRLFQRRFARGLPAGRGAGSGAIDHLYSELIYLHR